MDKYDDWKLDTPDNHLKPSGKFCENCGYELYIGDECKNINTGHYFHYECFDEFVQIYFDVRREIVE